MCVSVEAAPRFEPAITAFKTAALTTWLCRLVETHAAARNPARTMQLSIIPLFHCSIILLLLISACVRVKSSSIPLAQQLTEMQSRLTMRAPGLESVQACTSV